jgi:hypothetical protein
VLRKFVCEIWMASTPMWKKRECDSHELSDLPI